MDHLHAQDSCGEAELVERSADVPRAQDSIQGGHIQLKEFIVA
jgi:hypothetical protein